MEKKTDSGETLTEALQTLGITHEPTLFVGQRILCRGDEVFGNYTSAEGWVLVHELRGDVRDGEEN